MVIWLPGLLGFFTRPKHQRKAAYLTVDRKQREKQQDTPLKGAPIMTFLQIGPAFREPNVPETHQWANLQVKLIFFLKLIFL